MSDQSDNPFSPKLVCIQSILESTLAKLDIVYNIKPPKELSADESLNQAIVGKKAIEKRFRDLMHQRQRLKLQGKKPNADGNVDQLTQVLSEFRLASSRLKRKMEHNQSKSDLTGTFQNELASKVKQEKADLARVLNNTIQEIAACGSIPTLQRLLEAERNKKEGYDNTLVEVESLMKDVANLERKIKTSVETGTRQETEMKERILRLKAKLEQVKTELSVNQALKVRESDAKIRTNEHELKNTENKLAAELKMIELNVIRENKAFTFTMQHLQKSQKKLNNLSSEWKQKCDTEIPKTQTELEELTNKRDSTLLELKRYQEQYENEVAAKEARMEQEKREKMLKELQQASAINIQRVYRGFLVRNNIKKKKAEAKKKKKGKGKKKK